MLSSPLVINQAYFLTQKQAQLGIVIIKKLINNAGRYFANLPFSLIELFNVTYFLTQQTVTIKHSCMQ